MQNVFGNPSIVSFNVKYDVMKINKPVKDLAVIFILLSYDVTNIKINPLLQNLKMDIRRRTRFRRDIPLGNGKRNGFNRDETEMSGILSDLGSRLATFKVRDKLIIRRPLKIFL